MPVSVRRPRFVASSSAPTQLAAGVRAGPAAPVGYLGLAGDLTVLNVGGSLPGAWAASWDGSTLIITSGSAVVDHYRINAEVVFTGTNATMTDSVVHTFAGAIFGVAHTGSGYLTISDTTVVGDSSSGPQVNAITSDGGLIATRCDVSGTGDGIHLVAMPTTPSKISQCYVHDLAFLDEEQHLDGIQVFNHASTPAGYIIEHTYVAETLSLIGTPMNSASTAGPPSANSEPLSTATYDNNCFASGLYHLRINFRHQDTVVTNNNLGSVSVDEFGLLAVEEPAAISTWTNNRTGLGAAGTGTLIPQP